MRRRALVLAAVAGGVALLNAAPTLADTYDLDFSETSAFGPATYQAVVDTADAVDTSSGTTFREAEISRGGAVLPASALSVLYGTNIASNYFFLIDTDTPTRDFYTGSGTDVRFNVGSYSIADGATDGEGRLTISDTSISAAPEPGTWGLMLAGVALLGATLRFGRRRQGALLAA